MRYEVRKSVIDVVGYIWMPHTTAAMSYTVSSYDIENMREEDGTITRASVEDWLGSHSRDFQSITDFRASIEDGSQTIDIDWADIDNECTFNDCMFPSED
jgi:hypothetical protein